MTRLIPIRGSTRGYGKKSSSIRTFLLIGLCAALFPGAVVAQEIPSGAAPEAASEQARRPDPNDRLDATPWSAMVYRGWTNYHTLGRTLRFIWDYVGEDVYGLELAYTISPETGFGSFLDRVLASRFQVAGKLVGRYQESGNWISEVDAYIALRWRRLPWNHVLATSLAIGDGLSYVSRVPDVEIFTTEVGGTSQLLNYLMLEMTLAVPSLPYVQLVGRIHHRSGMFGVFGDAQESGSNAVGLGLRVHL